MSVFTEDDFQRLDYLILRDGPVVLYTNAQEVEKAQIWFESNNYQVHQFEKDELTEDFYGNFYEKMKQEDVFLTPGSHLDTLRDSLFMLPLSPERGILLIFFS